jgi:8-oxo-dGTP diphosphatase
MRAAVAVLYQDGKVLGVSRKTDSNDFGLPGGKVEEGESFEEGLAREVFEETGLTVIASQQVYLHVDEYLELRAYLVEVSHLDFHTQEAGVVAWCSWARLMNAGTYRHRNRKILAKALRVLDCPDKDSSLF